jgi:hypothetical protein
MQGVWAAVREVAIGEPAVDLRKGG